MFSYLHSLERAGETVFFTPVDNPKYPIGRTINIFTEKISESTNKLVLTCKTFKMEAENATRVRQTYVALISTVSSWLSM